MKSIIIYGSRYGSACRYAQELSKQTGIPDVSYQEAPLLSELETVVCIGAVCRRRSGIDKDAAKAVIREASKADHRHGRAG